MMRGVLLVCLCLLPLAGAQTDDASYPTTLYLYGSGGRDLVMTPVPPPPQHEVPPGGGIATSSACVEAPLQTFTSGQHHTWYAFVVPAPPELDGGATMSTQYRGIGADVRFDRDAGLEMHWFMATAGSAGTGAVVPRVILETTVREGDDISVDHAAFNAGQLIAQARTEPADLHPAIDHPQVTHHRVDDRDVYGFHTPLDISGNATVPQEESFNIRVDAFVENPLCDRPGSYLTPDLVKIHSSDGLRPRLDMSVFDPVRIESLSATWEDGHLVFEGRLQASFGSGDVILPADGLFSIAGPGEAMLTDLTWGRAKHHVEGDRVFLNVGHDPAITTRQAWDLRNASAAPGEYTVDLSVLTMSGANATAQVPFVIGDDDVMRTCSVAPPAEPSCMELQKSGKKSPSLLVPLVGLALLGAAWRRR